MFDWLIRIAGVLGVIGCWIFYHEVIRPWSAPTRPRGPERPRRKR